MKYLLVNSSIYYFFFFFNSNFWVGFSFQASIALNTDDS